ncbi:ABC transporter ATP-binding protein [Thermoflexus sp.]|uniref:ABC transporter ATP-binding protein n=1 Tax=Thermoflexus sp. TaxID=1969742 RepID=UPI0035E427C9
MKPLLQVRDLRVAFDLGRHGFLTAVDGVSFDLAQGEFIALVGESGSGKSTTALALIRLVPPPGFISGGRLLWWEEGKGEPVDLLRFSEAQMRERRWRDIAMVFQGAQNALNPVMRIAEQMMETVRAHQAMPRDEILDRAARCLRMVRLEPSRVLRAYPHELSGGMRQRVLIAMSLLMNPRLLILDEPTTALDVITQAHILEILREIQEQMGLTMLLLTHDLAVVAKTAHRVLIMYAGQIVEEAPTVTLFESPYHPYTRGLLQAVPTLRGDLTGKRPIPGAPPDLRHPPPGCRFHPRCPYADEMCRRAEPELEEVGNRRVACHHWRRVAQEAPAQKL